MNKPKGLGRGLDALLGGGRPGASRNEGELREILVGDLSPGKYQPRTRMDKIALEELAQSIRNRGIVQPILVRQISQGKFEIVAGERRWRAAQIAGLFSVPALVRDIPDEQALGIGLIENIQREDLNAIEEASGIKRLIDEFKLTHESAAHAVGRVGAALAALPGAELGVQIVTRQAQQARHLGRHARHRTAVALNAGGHFFVAVALRYQALATAQQFGRRGGRQWCGVGHVQTGKILRHLQQVGITQRLQQLRHQAVLAAPVAEIKQLVVQITGWFAG